MKYTYTLLKQDGATESLGEFDKEMDYLEVRKILNCQMLKIIPEAYHQKEWVKRGRFCGAMKKVGLTLITTATRTLKSLLMTSATSGTA